MNCFSRARCVRSPEITTSAGGRLADRLAQGIEDGSLDIWEVQVGNVDDGGHAFNDCSPRPALCKRHLIWRRFFCYIWQLMDTLKGRQLSAVAADIKLTHSIFALPFALLATFMAAGGLPHWGHPSADHRLHGLCPNDGDEFQPPARRRPRRPQPAHRRPGHPRRPREHPLLPHSDGHLRRRFYPLHRRLLVVVSEPVADRTFHTGAGVPGRLSAAQALHPPVPLLSRGRPGPRPAVRLARGRGDHRLGAGHYGSGRPAVDGRLRRPLRLPGLR